MWIGLIEATGTIDSDGWSNGLRRDIFVAVSKGHTPVIDKRQCRLIKSIKRIVRPEGNGLSGDIVIPFWANVREYTGVNQKGQRTGNPRLKLVMVCHSLAGWTDVTKDKFIVDFQTKLYWKSHGAQ